MAQRMRTLSQRLRHFDRAQERKLNKYTWSGLTILVIGLIVFIVGIVLASHPYSYEALVVGLGVILMLVGIIRVLIGLINPAAPHEVVAATDTPSHTTELHNTIFVQHDDDNLD